MFNFKPIIKTNTMHCINKCHDNIEIEIPTLPIAI